MHAVLIPWTTEVPMSFWCTLGSSRVTRSELVPSTSSAGRVSGGCGRVYPGQVRDLSVDVLFPLVAGLIEGLMNIRPLYFCQKDFIEFIVVVDGCHAPS